MNSPLVTVALSVFNLEDCVEEAIESVLKQGYSHWELIAIDDASTDGTYDVLKRYEGPQIRVFRNSVNRGTYWNRNVALMLAQGEFFTTIDGDDQYFPDKLKVQVEKIGDQDACMCHCIRRHPRYANGERIYISHNTLLFRRNLVEEIGYYDTVRFGADTEYIERIMRNRPIVKVDDILVKYTVRQGSLTEVTNSSVSRGSLGREIRDQYKKNYRPWHKQTRQPYLSFPFIRRPFAAGGPHHAAPRDRITVSLATVPERETSLRQTIDSLLPWADRINVFLNQYNQPPAWLSHPQINTQVSKINLGDLGKFWWAETTQGYHFLCDDDILYSEKYAELLLSKIEFYKREAIIGVHANQLSNLQNAYYSEQEWRRMTFRDDKSKDMALDFLDTGTMAYHTEKVRLSLDLLPENKTSDISLGLYAIRCGIPLICCDFPTELMADVPMQPRNSIDEHSLQNERSVWTDHNVITAKDLGFV